MIFIRTKARKYLPDIIRDTHGLNALDRLKIREKTSIISSLLKWAAFMKSKNEMKRYVLIKSMAAMELSELLRIIVVDVPERPRLRPYIRGQTFESMSIHLRMIDVAVSTRFRFQSFTQLRRLLAGFRFPTGKITLKHGYKIEAEELIMISLTRLSFPYRWSDLYE